MAKLQLQSQIFVDKKSYTVESLIHELRFLNPNTFVFLFENAKIVLYRQIRMDVLRSLLESYVKHTRRERFTLADELNYRLKWFYQYSDFQYVNLLGYYENAQLNQTYIEHLLLSVIEFLVDQKRENIIQGLLEAKKQQTSPYDFKNIVDYNQTLNKIFKDKDQEMDGLSLSLIRLVLFKSSTLQELKVFGEKYGVEVPRRLKKDQLLQVIFSELQSRGVLTENLKIELKKKSVILIQRYAIDHDIKVSTELKKDEIIEYILESSQHSNAFYNYPKDEDYELEIDDPFEFEEVTESSEPQIKKIVTSVSPVETKKQKEKIQDKNMNDNAPIKKIVTSVSPVETKNQKEKIQDKNMNDNAPIKKNVSSVTPVETKNQKEKIQDNHTNDSLPTTPTLTGFTFGGWFSDEKLEKAYSFSIIPEENITLFAKWLINSYTISFDTAGGSLIAAITQNYNTSVTAPNSPTRVGYTFGGWSETVPTIMPAENKTLIAAWTPITYTITFNTNNGNIAQNQVSTFTIESSNVTLLDASRSGFVFKGWYVESSFDTKVTQINPAIEHRDLSIYALFFTESFQAYLDAIEALPNPLSKEDKTKVLDLIKTLETFTKDEQVYVNQGVLEAALIEVKRLEVVFVEARIASIPTPVTHEDIVAIQAAKEIFEQLDSDQQEDVSNQEILHTLLQVVQVYNQIEVLKNSENIDEQNFEALVSEFNALPLNLVNPVLFKSSRLHEVNILGENYGILVPEKFKKQHLLEVIFLELQSRGALTEDLKVELKNKSVDLIQRYAMDHNIKVSTDLEKDEIKEYILATSQQSNNQKDKTQNESSNTVFQTTQTHEDILDSGGVPLILDRKTAKFLKLFAISQNQKLMILPDKKYNKIKRKFKVQYQKLGENPKTKKKHGIIGELFVLKFLSLLIVRALIFLLGVALVLGVVFVGYATASYLLNNETLNMVNDQINSFEFLGKGILDHLFDFYRQIGI
jgi:uncharacterized repeat protein (TIGR02543 family)